MYDLGWTRLCWPDAPVAAGETVGVLARHFGVWSLNACRIVYVVEEEDEAAHRYGFALDTLPGHVERGEERFTVEWRRDDDSVWYELLAFVRPAQARPVGTVAYPIARRIHRRFAADACRARAAAVAASDPSAAIARATTSPICGAPEPIASPSQEHERPRGLDGPGGPSSSGPRAGFSVSSAPVVRSPFVSTSPSPTSARRFFGRMGACRVSGPARWVGRKTEARGP